MLVRCFVMVMRKARSKLTEDHKTCTEGEHGLLWWFAWLIYAFAQSTQRSTSWIFPSKFITVAVSQTLLSSHATLLVSLSLSNITSHSPLCQSEMIPHLSRHGHSSMIDLQSHAATQVSFSCYLPVVHGGRAGAPNSKRAEKKNMWQCCEGGENYPAPVHGLKTTFHLQIYKEKCAEVCLDGTGCLIPRDLSPFPVTLSL